MPSSVAVRPTARPIARPTATGRHRPVRDILRVTVPEIPAIMGAIIDLQPRVTPVRAIAIALVKAGITAATDPGTDRATIMVTARAQAP